MGEVVIKAEQLSKQYRLGVVNSKTLSQDISRWWHLLRNKEDPFSKIGSNQIAASKIPTYNWALNNVSFEISRGEVLGIIGSNGAGKSTLLKILSRVTNPTKGQVKIKGRIAALLEIGTGFHPELTGRENIFLNGAIHGMGKLETTKKLDEIIDFSGVEKYIDTPVKRYSSGMYVRLAFAVAAHLEPEILVVDEVLAVGDAAFQAKCLGKMKDANEKEGRTVLFISHDMVAIKSLCKRAFFLQKGKLEMDGLPADVINHYLSGVTAVNETSGQINNSNRKRGDGRFISTGYALLDGARQPIQFTESGNDVIIAINYHVKEKGPDPVVIINVRNMFGQIVFNCLSRNSYNGLIPLSASGKIYCALPKLPLQPGNYSVDIILKYGYVFTDEVENAFVLPVQKGDFFNTGKINNDMINGLFVYHTWAFD